MILICSSKKEISKNDIGEKISPSFSFKPLSSGLEYNASSVASSTINSAHTTPLLSNTDNLQTEGRNSESLPSLLPLGKKISDSPLKSDIAADGSTFGASLSTSATTSAVYDKPTADKPIGGFSFSGPASTATAVKPIQGFSFGAAPSSTATTAATDKPIEGFHSVLSRLA